VEQVGDLVLVLNGDILTDADLRAMLAFHAERRAVASIYLTRVPDPTAYGLVELGQRGTIQRFIEKPDPAQITTDTVNAGVYLLARGLLERIPTGRAVSIEREFFPGLLADRLPFVGWVSGAYWLDIGSPAKYRQGQLDLLAGRVTTALAPAGSRGDGRFVAERAAVDAGARLTGPAVVGAGCRLAAGSRVGPTPCWGRTARSTPRRPSRAPCCGSGGGRRGSRPAGLHRRAEFAWAQEPASARAPCWREEPSCRPGLRSLDRTRGA
jgi:NDP-sugar pyrophosphorylase family protein